jgi:hypothetical protein
MIVAAYPIAGPLMATGSLQYYYHAYGQAASDTTKDLVIPAIDGIECDTVEHLTFHIHTQLNITINNQSYRIPAGIGIVQGYCIYWLHTHDDSGWIHIESPVKREFTIGQFLSIWNKFNSSDAVVQNLTDNSIVGNLTVYVNGTQMSNNSTDYRDLELKDRGNISLIISHS